jgi:AcrR family transcriptional regulator
LLAGVAKAVNKYGYQQTRIDHIAQAADAPVGLFYRYFRSKADATLEVLRRMLEEYRASIPLPRHDTSFWDRELALHRNYISLFGERAGLLGCYFSYDFGEAAFESLFVDETRRFIREHSSAVRLAISGTQATELAIRPIALALVCMSDNFAYRYYTGRDELPRNDGTDVAWLLAALRYRGFLLQNPPRPHAVDLSVLQGPLDAVSEPELAAHPAARQPIAQVAAKAIAKRSDAQVTLRQIRAVTLALLDRLGYDDLRITDIEIESGLTRGVLYYHFKDKRDLVASVLAEWVDSIHTAMLASARSGEAKGGAFSSLHQLAQALVVGFVNAPGVVRTLYHLEEQDSGVAAHYRGRRREWAALIAAAIARYTRADKSHRPLLEKIGYAFLDMADRLLYELYVTRFPGATEIMQPAQVSTLLASLWHRMAFLSNPPRSALEMFPVLRQLHARANRSDRRGDSRR